MSVRFWSGRFNLYPVIGANSSETKIKRNKKSKKKKRKHEQCAKYNGLDKLTNSFLREYYKKKKTGK